ncbi:DUF1028 domain-containing protein [Salinicola rhizosphaerae]|uniref:DUF1028 domain-containing protein n=1 Tax=Salinicola rhizosphaerae TaxID=1443141 RepID=A0ABQ3EDN6_9GAMM|nr:DUF1028 domain-containing protein [Salinicola rhizosphaerae]GHB34393.1 hypothetical protein GCM10009038_36920 [Salinicola rhizosphaerae]
MTFSIAARCAETGETGCAVTSSSICVAARCAFAGPNGAVLTQNVTNPALGPQGLALMAAGRSPQETLERLLAGEAAPEYRQLLLIDGQGRTAVYDGDNALGVVGRADGVDCVAAGNLLADAGVPQAMVRAFEQSEGPLAERLLVAMEAGLAAGGEAGPIYSAGLVVARPNESWPVTNLRVDWGEAPITELRALWTRYAPQLEDYVTRARKPDAAPSYGVPGE